MRVKWPKVWNTPPGDGRIRTPDKTGSWIRKNSAMVLNSGESSYEERSCQVFLVMLLAIETSGTQGSVAIFDGPTLRFERILGATGTRHAQTLPAEVAHVLAQCELQPHQIQAVAVSIGPGSFTGLRVGLTFAKTFAWLNDARLVAVDTLRAITQQVPPDLQYVTAIVDAQRTEFFAATYCWNAELGLRCAIDDVHLVSVADLPTEHPIVGPAGNKLQAAAPDRFHVLDESLWQPRAISVGRIGLHMLDQQQLSDPDSLEPVYIRLSYAEEKRREA
ncbi:MAG: tRNA (adenosine(37)-N6)-threonylcarbamoyltransferase complex dimerization subunit type 1 TsaB [Planctomycetales bacterium]|nr:tRNA (adenosine(37)-N6)-threonylcarbamoyltransferase complex dimerization subunit type 1 TsaB [Planctomycetales bacterium]